MQEILGKQRIQLLVFMLVLNAALAGSYYYYIQPLKQTAVSELQNLRADASKRRNQIRELRMEFERLMPKIGDYKRLQEKGFFNNQKRTLAQEKIREFRDRSNLLVAKYEIQSAKVVEDARADDADYAVLSSPVTIEMEALDDIDIYTFINLMYQGFPGNIDVQEINIERQKDLNKKRLQKIASGEPEVLIEAEMKFNWRSMVPKSEMDDL